VARISRELKAGMEQWGYSTLVDMTPCEVGRHPELMKQVAQNTGANVIAVTGFFPERMGVPYWYRRQTVDELTEFYARDLTEGMVFAGCQTDIKAGAIKIATGQESVNPMPSPIGPNGRRIHQYEDRLIRAAGRAQKTTGCCINTHTDPMDYTVTNPGIEQIDIIEEEGGDPTKVIIGHAFVEPIGYLAPDGRKDPHLGQLQPGQRCDADRCGATQHERLARRYVQSDDRKSWYQFDHPAVGWKDHHRRRIQRCEWL